MTPNILRLQQNGPYQLLSILKHADKKEKVGRQDSNNQRIDAFIFVSNQFLVSLYCTLVSDILTAEVIKLKLFVGHYNQISLK